MAKEPPSLDDALAELAESDDLPVSIEESLSTSGRRYRLPETIPPEELEIESEEEDDTFPVAARAAQPASPPPRPVAAWPGSRSP